MNSPKICVLILKKHMDIGALESHIIRVLRILDKSKVTIDFLLDYSECFHKKEIESLGGNIYVLPDSCDIKFRTAKLSNFINERNYQIVVKVVETVDDFEDFAILESLKIKSIIARISGSIKTIDTSLWSRMQNVLLVVTEENSNYHVPDDMYARVLKVKNAFQLEKYKFKPDIRNEYRKALNFDSCFIIGNVARFYKEKNHSFLISIFHQFNLMYPQSKLVLVGDGGLRNEIVDLISKYKIEDKVILLGMRDDIANILMAIDVFCLSSYEENATNSILEAQASGLYCVASDSISEKANITGNVQYISLDAPNEWLDVLNQEFINTKCVCRELSYDIMKQAGFDIIDVVKMISDYFSKLIN